MGTHRKPAGFSLTLKMVERVELLRLLDASCVRSRRSRNARAHPGRHVRRLIANTSWKGSSKRFVIP